MLVVCAVLFASIRTVSSSSVVLTTMGNIDYKATFDNLSKEGCKACVKAGYGWNEATKRCGGFENDRCPGDDDDDDDNDDGDDDDGDDDDDDDDDSANICSM